MFKNRAIRKYFKRLYPCLKNRYGLREKYTKGQIIRTISECGFSEKYHIYALAIFLDKDNFMSLVSEYPNIHLNNVRNEIADKYFDGDLEYVYKDIHSRSVGNTGVFVVDD